MKQTGVIICCICALVGIGLVFLDILFLNTPNLIIGCLGVIIVGASMLGNLLFASSLCDKE